MNWQQPFSHYLASTSPVVQLVLLILVIASVISWTIIFQRWFALGKAKRANRRFEKQFLKQKNLDEVLALIDKKPKKTEGLALIFREGYKEWQHSGESDATKTQRLEAVERMMRVYASYEEEELEANLPFLATIGSVSPYIGLFGTVWGIMMSFHSLGGAEQVTISMVAPGISEALIATALGLFAAIPAVIFYNRYAAIVDSIIHRFEIFQDEFISLLGRGSRTAEGSDHAIDEAQ